jgi:hypothetical protein
MPRCWRFLILALPLLAALPLVAAPDPPAGAPAAAGSDPDRYARLRREAQAFLALPPERRERMRKLDERLQREPEAKRKHLRDVLERYADWLDRLPPDERREVVKAPTRQARLRKVRELRAEQWVRRQPQAVRERLRKLQGLAGVRDAVELVRAGWLPAPSPGAQAGQAVLAPLLDPGFDPRAVVLGRLRREERRRHHAWQVALHRWDELGPLAFRPLQLSELQDPVRRYVEEYLKPMLSGDEKDRLRKAEGQFEFLNVLVELADAHPPALPGPRGPTTFKELPQELKKRLWATVPFKTTGKGAKFPWGKQLKPKRWPEFAVSVTRYAATHQVRMPHELWPYSRLELSQGVQKFLKNRLEPKLDVEEKKLLKAKEGKWPDFPETIQLLARRHNLTVPWQTLPGPRALWDPFRPRAKGSGPKG